MLKVHLSATTIERMRNAHARALRDIILKRLNRAENNFLRSYFKSKTQVFEVLKCPTADLLDLNKDINDHFAGSHSPKQLKDAFKRVFNYKAFRKKNPSDYDGFDLCAEYGFVTCPYCNMADIKTIRLKKSGKNLESPPLDHFHTQSKYPLLGLSFFNMIPSCWKCNSTYKKEQDTKSTTHLNPHMGGFEKNFVFGFTDIRNVDDILSKNRRNFNLSLLNKTGDVRFDGNNAILSLDIRYSDQKKAAIKALRWARKSTPGEIKGIRELFGNSSLPYLEVMDAMYDFDEMHQEQFSKLTRDIFDDYASAELRQLLGV